MIKNEKQYEYSKDCAKRFEYSIAVVEQDEAWKKRDPERWQLDIDVKKSHLVALQEEIAEYEKLFDCDKSQPIKIKVENFNKLPDVLIKARIAAKMSQKELADILGFEEQRIKECEDKDYQCASFCEILEVSAALGVEFDNAFVQVNFEEIEEGKKSAQKWHKWRELRMNLKSQAS
ncbi:helix-turn-helix domain-containing protein [Iningainema tapete]|uniref:Helix-turn-helix transcriptional regulator n=1 Tax=Iningainema tapete BLCC-T55 TaxID=2748662 RepID=A0A8J7C7E8_9CYAN|nr:helix-turn-helix transcriptional regulator [Iningainema tapete]MBD2773086.1 helix-turn-helix transcriptional regulator [Iningainema tapete BLCC-T55]